MRAWKNRVRQAVSCCARFFHQYDEALDDCGAWAGHHGQYSSSADSHFPNRNLLFWLCCLCMDSGMCGFYHLEGIIRINSIYLMAGLCIALLPILMFPITRQKGDEIRAQLLAREAQQTAKDNTL
ncbi:hypothetical protein ACDL92_11010 [Ihubacter sp. mB4P-1]|uniref:hypothetical protein n=1 Tax=Ihubacter sp. mB4P-1 TaxID=3242370 RepID=UPI001379AFDA